MVSLQISCLQLHLRPLSYLQENREKQNTNNTLFTHTKATIALQIRRIRYSRQRKVNLLKTMKMQVNLIIQKLIFEVIDMIL